MARCTEKSSGAQCWLTWGHDGFCSFTTAPKNYTQADLDRAVAEAVRAEREACANDLWTRVRVRANGREIEIIRNCMDVIRARGEVRR